MRNCQYENTAIASSKGKFGGKLLSRQIGNTNMTTKRTMSGS